jgi:queuine tRNA-ribosyltransferase
VHEDLRRESAERNAAAAVDGIAIGGTLGREKAEMHAVLGFTVPLLPDENPRHLLGIGEVDDILVGIGMGIDLFDCAIPTRLARHGTALAPDPEGRFRIDLTKSAYADDDSPIVEGCPCEGCSRHTRAYLHYLARNKDLTGSRLLTLHNLTYMERLVAGARGAIAAGRFADYSRAVVGGTAPWAA